MKTSVKKKTPRFITPKRSIVWSFDHPIDMADPVQRQWYIKQVLLYGRREDLVQLDWNEIKRVLPDLLLPKVIRALWEDYFSLPIVINKKRFRG